MELSSEFQQNHSGTRSHVGGLLKAGVSGAQRLPLDGGRDKGSGKENLAFMEAMVPAQEDM